MFRRIALVSIPVKDQEAAKNFYTKILGRIVVQEMPFGTDAHRRWILLELPRVATRADHL